MTERFKQMDTIESDVPPFHYGSHYSSAGAVLFCLGLRLGLGSGSGFRFRVRLSVRARVRVRVRVTHRRVVAAEDVPADVGLLPAVR